jgi:hypothetical protein
VAGDESAWELLFGLLAETTIQVSLVVTGGGTGAIARCFGRPGASRNFVEAVIPYSRSSLADYLIGEPHGSSASSERAQQLARTAHARAENLADCKGSQLAAGIALTAALPTIPKRRGADRIDVALQTGERRVGWSLEMSAGRFDRETAESLCDRMLLLALSDLIGRGIVAQQSLRDDFLDCGIQLTRSED